MNSEKMEAKSNPIERIISLKFQENELRRRRKKLEAKLNIEKFEKELDPIEQSSLKEIR